MSDVATQVLPEAFHRIDAAANRLASRPVRPRPDAQPKKLVRVWQSGCDTYPPRHTFCEPVAQYLAPLPARAPSETTHFSCGRLWPNRGPNIFTPRFPR